MADRTVLVEFDRSTAIVRLNRPPANAIDIEFAAELEAALDGIEQRAAVRAVVLTGNGACFSAGLDLKQVPSYDREQQRSMVNGFNRLVMRLYGLGKPLIGALNGHTVAGGLVLALCCDHRIAAAGSHTYGLTEARVGIPFPFSAITVVRAELNAGAARALVLLGSKSGPESMQAQGVIDRIVPADELLPASLAAARDASRMPEGSYARIKRQLRGESLARMREGISAGSDPCLNDWLSPATATAAARILTGRETD